MFSGLLNNAVFPAPRKLRPCHTAWIAAALFEVLGMGVGHAPRPARRREAWSQLLYNHLDQYHTPGLRPARQERAKIAGYRKTDLCAGTTGMLKKIRCLQPVC